MIIIETAKTKPMQVTTMCHIIICSAEMDI